MDQDAKLVEALPPSKWVEFAHARKPISYQSNLSQLLLRCLTRERSVDQLRLVLYSFDSNTDRGVTYDGISKTISRDLDHPDRHGHRDRVLPLRADPRICDRRVALR